MQNQSANEDSLLSTLSSQTADAVESVSAGLVLVNGRQRLPGSGVVFAPDSVTAFPNKLIAQRLQIGEHTVKYHVSSFYSKLGAASRTEVVSIGERRGVISI